MQPSPFGRANSPQSIRGTATTEKSRGRARGRGRGRGQSAGTSPSAPSDNPSALQSNRGSTLRAGLGGLSRGVRSRGARGSVRGGNVSRSFNSLSSPPSQVLQSGIPPPPINPRPEDIRETNHEAIAARRTKLHGQYEQYQKRAIQQKLMSDPDKREKLENAIFTKGTCTHMCDEKERVDRIFELQLDRAEMLPHPETGQLVPVEGRMVKRFRRSAAGVGKQIPEELRTSETLQKTMDYLINNIIGPSSRLAQHHKFVWDRTRAIRNDCSIQSFTQPEDVKREVDCYERIARFHILSSHLLSKPGALQNGEDFVHKQEIEQLTKTFQTLIDKYDGFGHTLDFPHEAEFRAYFILFAPMTTIADLDDQVQRWPRHVLDDGRVQTALKLRAAAESTDQPVGSRRFEPVPCFIAQKNAGLYWDLLSSQRVGYLMACVAEMSFRNIRFAALDSLWRAGKNASEKGQATMRTWTRSALRNYLGFDDDDQVEDFCSQFGLNFVGSASSEQEHLDFKSHGAPSLDYSSLGQDQIFSESIVEKKRQARNLVAVLNGMSIAAATKEGMIEDQSTTAPTKATHNRSSMFLSQDAEDDEVEEAEDQSEQAVPKPFGSLNPLANTFTPGAFKPPNTGEAVKRPGWMTQFGQPRPNVSALPSGPSNDIFGRQNEQTPSSGAPAQSSSEGLGTAQKAATQSTDSWKTDAKPSLQVTDANSVKPTFQPPPLSQSNPFAAPRTQESISPFQFTQPAEKTPLISPQEKQTPNTAATQTTFSWSRPPSEPARTSTPSQPIFSTLQPPQTPSETPKFSPQPQAVAPPPQDPSLSPFQPPFDVGAVLKNPLNDSSKPSTDRPDSTQTFTPFVNEQPTPSLSSIDSAQIEYAKANSRPPSASTSQLNAYKPSSQPLKFPPLFGSKDSSTTPIGSPDRTSKALDSGKEASPPRSTTSQVEFTSALSSRTALEQPQAPQRKPVDKDQLVEHLCRIGLTQKDGILDMFVAAKVNSLCHEIFQAFQTHRLDRKISKLKKIHLKRKFFALWRSRVNLKRLQKRAEKRRKMFAASVKAQNEEDKRRREEVAFLAEVMQSEQNKRRIQEEQRKLEEEKVKRRTAELERLQSQNASVATTRTATKPQTNTTQTAGQKRKMLVSKSSRNNLQDVAMSPMHKRSRTLGTDSSDLESSRATTRMPPPTKPSSSSDLRRSLSHRSLRQSVTQQGVDQTESDYFRLKALGVDPNTPLIPDTAASLAAKQRKEAEHREAVLSKMKIRPTSMTAKSVSTPASTSAELPKPVYTSQPTPVTQPTSRPSPSIVDESEDSFLRELREARQAMSHDAEWLKSEAARLEKEIEQQEEARRSIGSNHGADDLSTQSVNGFSRSINGHEYVPPTLKPGQTLSRTEQRIRATGARGLANQTIGGSPRPSSRYMPVAMSRRTASQLQSSFLSHDQASSPSSRSKRSIDEADVRNGLRSSSQSFQPAAGQNSEQAIKKPRQDPSRSSSTRMSIQALQSLQSTHDPHENGYGSNGPDDEATEDDETGDELAYVGQAQNGDGVYEYDDADEDDDQYSGDLDDDEEEEEEDEDAEGDDDSDDEHGRSRSALHPSQYGLVDAEAEEYDEDDEEEVPGYDAQFAPLASGSGHGSRAVSAGVATPDTGLGSTAAEAIELSD